jgi:hypothetical protein
MAVGFFDHGFPAQIMRNRCRSVATNKILPVLFAAGSVKLDRHSVIHDYGDAPSSRKGSTFPTDGKGQTKPTSLNIIGCFLFILSVYFAAVGRFFIRWEFFKIFELRLR